MANSIQWNVPADGSKKGFNWVCNGCDGCVDGACIGAVCFYLRFLLALCREYKYRWIGYLVRLEPDSDEYTVLKHEEIQISMGRAA